MHESLLVYGSGAAWVPLDPSHPIARHREVIKQTRADLALTSSANIELCSSLINNVLDVASIVDRRTLSVHGQTDGSFRLRVPASSAMYALFTSGTTGTPKGFVMEHGAVMSGQSAIGKRLGLSENVNMLQFASYVFDLSIGEIVGPLIHGATICIPSDSVRVNGLSRFVQENDVNWAFLTPAFARTLKPDAFSSLELLLFAGEAVPRDLFDAWFSKVRLINGWGPAETCCFSSLHEWASADESPMTIGQPVGGFCWIVDPDNPSRLAPAGTVGEVVIQGPALLREYLAAPEATAASTMTELPDWAPKREEPYWNRFYKSGDLCFYNSSGQLEFASRKDSQIKIRGLRVELEEVEHHVRLNLPGSPQVAVDVLRSTTGSHLVAYFCLSADYKTPGAYADDDVFASLDEKMKSMIGALVGLLDVSLPRYMVPTYFIPCNFMPLITSTKLDRGALRKITAVLPKESLAEYALQDDRVRPPENTTESQLQALWSEILGIPMSSIGRDQNFLKLGGDSISAIHFVSAARERGIVLTVADVFEDPRLLAVADKATGVQDDPEDYDIEPFSLLEGSHRGMLLDLAIQEQTNLLPSQISDAFPTTAMQSGLMTLSVRQPGSYITKYFFKMLPNTDLSRFQEAVEGMIQLCTNLRTRIINVQGTAVQIVTESDVAWESTAGLDLNTFIQETNSYTMTFGSRLNRYALISQADGASYFVWIAHHSVTDGWSTQLALHILHALYNGEEPAPLEPYNRFIKYVSNISVDDNTEFWRDQLRGAQKPMFPSMLQFDPHIDSQVYRLVIDMSRRTNNSVTSASLLRGAWALVLALQNNTDDITFGATYSGRKAPVLGLHSMPGLAICTVPVRTRIHSTTTVSDFLEMVQSQAMASVAHEQFGLQNISKVSTEAREACDFSSLMVIQPKQFSVTTDLDEVEEAPIMIQEQEGYHLTERQLTRYFNYPLVLLAATQKDNVEIRFFYNSPAISSKLMQAIANQLNQAVQEFLDKPDSLLRDISLTSSDDLDEARETSDLKPPVESCIHWLVQDQIKTRPSDPAICSWDGEFTYEQLGTYANSLAAHLQSLGVGPETIVPVCFPKSAWAVVSMLAIDIAGAAFVPFDPSTPEKRLHEMANDVEAKLILCAPSCSDTVEALGLDMVVIDQDAISSMDRISTPVKSSVKPSNASFIIFTSGSTGRPKGMVIEHSAIASSANGYGAIQNIGPSTRVFAYSAYTFDVGVMDVLVTLSRGACICIPSEWERHNEIAGAINRTSANWAFLTPSVATLIKPAQVPSLRKLGLGGEAVTQRVVDLWKDHAELHGLYGPAESSICAWRPNIGASGNPNNIGTPISSAFWVVAPGDPRKLLPIGAVGELMIQGSLLARGYLSATPPEAAAAWLDNVDWLPGTTCARAYLTGDLVRRNEDGTFDYIGRKDSQTKLHGQRIELGAIEKTIEKYLPSNMMAIATTIASEDGGSDVLAALLWYTSGSESEHGELKLVQTVTDEMRQLITNLDSELGAIQSSHSVPSMYIIFQGVPPRLSSGKVDRRTLCSMASNASYRERMQFAPGNAAGSSPPSTTVEHQLASIWAQVLHVDQSDISRNDNFLRGGGDSMSAIRLASLAQQGGLALSVASIFSSPILRDMALKCERGVAQAEDAEPFTLLKGPKSAIIEQVKQQCGLENGAEIQDVYPVSSLQEGLMALSAKQSGSYTAQNYFRLGSTVDVGRFKDAWEHTVQQCTNLRTRIVNINGTALQAVVSGDSFWYQLSGPLKQDLRATPMTYGSRLCRFALFEEDGQFYFTLVAHHAIYDGWTLNIITRALVDSYFGKDISGMVPYTRFIDYVQKLNTQDTQRYWTEELEGATKGTFPGITHTRSSEKPNTRNLSRHLSFPSSGDKSITNATIVRAAWGLLLATYFDTRDVTFGMTLSGRQAPVAGIDRLPGALVATVPIRIRLDEELSISDYLQNVQIHASEMIRHEQYGLQNISKVNRAAEEVCAFDSLLVIQPFSAFDSLSETAEEMLCPCEFNSSNADSNLQDFFSYPLVVQCSVSDQEATLNLTYDANIYDERLLHSMLLHFDHVVQQLVPGSESTLAAIRLSTDWDLKKACEWNRQPAATIDSTWHDRLSDLASEQPNAIAINAWDRILTYNELNDAADRLAHHLVQQFDVKQEDLVIVCFEKSAWHFVSILAINKAGATWVPLDAGHPRLRHEQILQQTGAQLILTSPAHAKLWDGLSLRILEVTPTLDENLSAFTGSLSRSSPIESVSPRTAAYIIFTSGSTGVPKGFVIEHRSLVTSMVNIGKRLGITSHVRMLQFASFVFDLSIGEIICPLIHGASIHVPDEETRMNSLGQYIESEEITWALLTPSFTRTIKPEDVPSLELLALAGELVSQDLLNTWFGKVRLINGWGPAETTVFSSLHEYSSAEESPATIGHSVGAQCWIVDPQDPYQLAPIGTVGEVVLQGPTLLREYIGDDEKTSSSLLSPIPSWAPMQGADGYDRMYLSGDLCFYNPDGTMQFFSRKDTQIKIRGLRVELGEVEDHLRRVLPDAQQLLVDVHRESTSASLVAYFCMSSETRKSGDVPDDVFVGELFLPLSETMRDRCIEAYGQMVTSVPSYMIPSVFIPCGFMPSITSTKLDRKALKAEIAKLTDEELRIYSLADTQKRQPRTPMEELMQRMWSEVLGIPCESIGRDDSFLRIGGDSIAAIRLVQRCLSASIAITVKDVFDDPRLLSVSSRCQKLDARPGASRNLEPFSLLDASQRAYVKSLTIIDRLGLQSSEQVEDAFPCIPIQAGLMALSIKQQGAYIVKRVYRLARWVDIERFKEAWRATVELYSSLRTRIIEVSGTLVQCLIRDEFSWDDMHDTDVDAYMTASGSFAMGYGSRLNRYAIIEQDGEQYFAHIAHHAVFDGWLMSLIFDSMHKIYQEVDVSRPPSFSGFVQHVMDLDTKEAGQYWRKQLAGARASHFPTDPRTAAEAKPKFNRSSRQLDVPLRSADSSVTKASIIRAAYAIVLGAYCNTQDVCFGATVSGRTASVPGVEEMAGPTLTTIPVRINLSNQRVTEFLKQVQSNASESTTYEQFGLQHISKLSDDAKSACDFTSLLSILPVNGSSPGQGAEEPMITLAADKLGNSLDNYLTIPLTIEAALMNDTAQLSFFYNTTVMDDDRVESLYQHMCHVILQLNNSVEVNISDISISGPWDIEKNIQWNLHSSSIYEECLHNLVERQARLTPDREAIYTSTGAMSYSKLSDFSDRVAQYLVDLGVKEEDLVPICFEKSAWAIVAMMGVLKTGGAFIPLDPSHALARRMEIVQQTNAKVILASNNTLSDFKNLVSQVVEVSSSTVPEMKPPASQLGATANPSNSAYVIFSSGSTGKPKGIVVEHAAICTSIMSHGRMLLPEEDLRMLAFSSYAFDASIYENFLPLIHGGTVCKPSEEQRLQYCADFMNESRTNVAMISPSFSRTIIPKQVSSLKILALVGEASSRSDLEIWCDHVKLLNGYGPTETAVINSFHHWNSSDESPYTIGSATVNKTWVINPDNPNMLAPIGSVGELLVQGPSIAREYYGDEKRTDSAFIKCDLEWLPKPQQDEASRLYRTGDMVSFNSDGTLNYHGRLDNQVKLRGQRIELGEVEFRLKKASTGIQNAVSTVLNVDDRQVLVALVSFRGSSEVSDWTQPFLPMTDDIRTSLVAVSNRVKSELPSYMVPTFILPLKSMPLLEASMKVDRKLLDGIVRKLSAQQLSEYSLGAPVKVEPTTETELQLRELWAQILGINAAEIGKNDEFLQVGGDSISSIRLASSAQELGLNVTVREIFKDSRLSSMAASAMNGPKVTASKLTPFSLLRTSQIEDLLSHVRQQCSDISIGSHTTTADLLDDAYPTSPLQDSMIATTMKHPGFLVARRVWEIPRHVDLQAFTAAWDSIVQHFANLRTRILKEQTGTIQVVVKKQTVWEETQSMSLRAYIKYLMDIRMGYGTQLSRHAIVTEGDDRFFVWIHHHSLIDGWTLAMILQQLAQAYRGASLAPLTPFANFIQHSRKTDSSAAENFWGGVLEGAQTGSWPKNTPVSELELGKKVQLESLVVKVSSLNETSITLATAMTAAWGLALAKMGGLEDVCFMTTSSGRQAPLKGIENVAGLTTARVPVRLQINRSQSVSALLHGMQATLAESVAYEQYGVSKMMKLAPHLAEAIALPMIQVAMQPASQNLGNAVEVTGAEILSSPATDKYKQDVTGFHLTPVVYDCFIGTDYVLLSGFYNPDVVDESTLSHFQLLLKHYLHKLCNSLDRTMDAIITP